MDAVPVLIADSDGTFRAAVAALLQRVGIACIAATSGDEAVDTARSQRPSVVVLEVELRDRSGYETCRALRELYGETLPILFVSSKRTKPHDRVAGLLLGADDYLTKPADPDDLLARILRAQRRSKREGGDTADRASHVAPAQRLTVRELQILRMVATGRSPNEVAEELVISPKTVASHLQRILTKLSVHSRTQAVARAYELGLVQSAETSSGSE